MDMFRLHQRRTPKPVATMVRGHSSAGRALRWQRRGQGFDSPWLHHFSLPPRSQFIPLVLCKSSAMAASFKGRFGGQVR